MATERVEDPVGSDSWQLVQLEALAFDRYDDLEFRVRDMARNAVEEEATFTHGTNFPYSRWALTSTSVLDASATTTYNIITVKLIPRLQHYPQAARLIAEKIIRRQIEEIHATS